MRAGLASQTTANDATLDPVPHHRRPQSQRLFALALLAPLALLALQLGLHWSHGAAPWELCYARTLAGGAGLALQPGAVQSHGVDSLPWVGLLAALSWLGLPLWPGAKLLSAGLLALTLLLLPGLSARLAGRTRARGLDLLPGLLLVLTPLVVLHTTDGSSGALALLLAALALQRWFAAHAAAGEGRLASVLLGLVLGLLTTCGPLGLALALALGVTFLVAQLVTRQLRLVHLLVLLLPGLGLLLLGWLYYHLFARAMPWQLMAADRAVATPLGSDAALAAGLGQLWHGLGRSGALVALVPLGLVGLLRWRRYFCRVAAGMLAATAAAWSLATAGGDAVHQLQPLWLATALLASSGLQWLRDGLGRLPAPASFTRAARLSLLAGALVGPLAASWSAWRHPPPSPLQNGQLLARRVAQRLGPLGAELPQLRVLTDRPAAFAWHGFQVRDLTGRSDPALRRHNAGKQPANLNRLALDSPAPQVILESRRWRHLHRLSQHPVVRRRFVPLPLRGRPDLSLSLSRQLLLEPAPWLPHRAPLQLAPGLELVGVRVRPAALELLWLPRTSRTAGQRLELGVGQHWRTHLLLGSPLYPPWRWRAGELIRQRVGLPHRAARGTTLWLRLGQGPRRQLTGLPLSDARLRPARWAARHTAQLLRQHQLLLAEAEAPGYVDSHALVPRLRRTFGARIERLMQHRLWREASQQLAELRQLLGGRLPAALTPLAQQLAQASLAAAQHHRRWQRWPAVLAALRSAARADPRDPTIARQLEQARLRQPLDDRLRPVLQRELAARAQALRPSPAGLERLLQAQLSLGQGREALIAWLRWRPRLSPSPQGRYLFARALATTGRLQPALGELRQLLRQPATRPAPRWCPGWFPLRPLALQARLRRLLALPTGAPLSTTLLQGEPVQLAPGVALVASCASWRPGAPARVELYLQQRTQAARSLTLRVGGRRLQLPLESNPGPLTRQLVQLTLPPATYPLRLAGSSAVVPLAPLSVGVESSFGFELPRYAPWTPSGAAFGSSPVVGRSASWRYLVGFQGERYADSFINGFDRATGALRSPPFRLRRAFLGLLVAGGRQADVGVELWVDGTQVHTVRGAGDELMRLTLLPVSRWHGQTARLVIRDNSRGPWGHLAVDSILQLDGPGPGLPMGR